MSKNTILLFLSFFSIGQLMPSLVFAQTLAQRLSGRILLQVERHGEAWYVDPANGQRYVLGKPQDAYQIMRTRSLGIAHTELTHYIATRFPARLSGRILLDVQSHGEAYYVVPMTMRGVYLGKPADAYEAMRTYGLGIRNTDLAKIPSASPVLETLEPTAASVPPQSSVPTAPIMADAELTVLEHQAFDLINQHRQSIGVAPLVWNDAISSIARQHSADMANGTVGFGHDGFDARVDSISKAMTLTSAAENVAWNNYATPAKTAVDGWIQSQGHRTNLEHATYMLSGMGVAKTADGKYYFTQLFVGQK